VTEVVLQTDRGASGDEAGDADAAEAVGGSRRRVASAMPTRSMELRHIVVSRPALGRRKTSPAAD